MNTQLPSKEENRLWDCWVAKLCDFILSNWVAAFFVIACVA